jgi:hypothetical protein
MDYKPSFISSTLGGYERAARDVYDVLQISHRFERSEDGSYIPMLPVCKDEVESSLIKIFQRLNIPQLALDTVYSILCAKWAEWVNDDINLMNDIEVTHG